MTFTITPIYRRTLGKNDQDRDNRLVEALWSVVTDTTTGEIDTQMSSIEGVLLTMKGTSQGASDAQYTTSASILTVTNSANPTGLTAYAVGVPIS